MAHELGIVGAGNMAEAIVRSVIAAGAIRKEGIVAADVSPARREVFAKQIGVKAVERNDEAVRGARMVLL
ncbi:MAG TPA: NAD(P)-binding domain-containing protein, partial [Tepidisphaeraceae bacterium]|nr:NAD(P)-binding domain-containing protein [Tepidisphaeraceae bacterium]